MLHAACARRAETVAVGADGTLRAVYDRLSERGKRIARGAFVAGYALAILLLAAWRFGPRAFWTGLLPLVPIGIVVAGYHSWRHVCPLAFFTRLGGMVPRKSQRPRVGATLEKYSYLVSLGALFLGLTLRLLVINGDGPALALFLVALALAAFGVGVRYTGKTWCNFFCPVGIVEKIYTEPANLYAHGNSQCAKCTACKKHCPDIDEENHYWKELESPARRWAYTAFPGLVWGFYLAYALPRGTMDDYYSGRWTYAPAQYRAALGPGLFFAHAVPQALSVPLFLALCMALSAGAFVLVERAAQRIDEKRARHLTLTAAAFTAFVSFYLFAGQPLYRRVGAPLMALASVLTVFVATLFLTRRWVRTEDDFVQERSVKKLLAKWPYAEPPPKDPKEVFFFVKSRERERDKVVAAYADAVREVLADGVVEPSEQRLLDRLRAELGITKAEHDKVMARLSAEDRALFDPSRSVSVEQRAQLDGYKLALQSLLLKSPSETELEELRRSYGIEPGAHAQLLAALRSTDSPLRARVEEQLALLGRYREALRQGGPLVRLRGFQLLFLVLQRRQASAVERALELLAAITGEQEQLGAIARKLLDDAEAKRTEGLAQLRALDAKLADALREPVLERRPTPAPEVEPAALRASLLALLSLEDPFVLAATAIAASLTERAALEPKLATLAAHPHPLVRESIALSAARLGDAAVLEKLRADEDPRVRAAAAPQGESGGLGDSLRTQAALRAVQTVHPTDGMDEVSAFAELPTPERMLVMARIPLFADLQPEQLFDLAVLAGERTLAADEVLCREGEPGEEVFVLIAGEGTVSREVDGASRTVNAVHAGDCVGELAVLDEAPRAATVRARGELRVLSIGGHAFRALLSEQPELSAALLGMLARRLRSTLARVG